MNGEQKTWALVTLIISATLIAVTFTMARCSVEVNGTQTEAAECTKRGGTWHPSADPGSRFCEERGK